MRRLVLAAAFLLLAPALGAQGRTDGLITMARAYITAHQYADADTTLHHALDAAGYLMDSVHVFVWRAILEHIRGSDSLARESFHTALVLYPALQVNGLDEVSPGLSELFDSEARSMRVYGGNQLDQQAAWKSGPQVAYPADMRRRHVGGTATVMITVDSSGRLEPQSFHVVEVPDTEFVEPLRQMLLASTFTPGRVKGQAVRSALNLTFALKPPPPQNPMALIGNARDQLHAHNPDSAVTLTTEALDSANQATPGVRVYALLVQGLAWKAKGKDSAAAVSFDEGLSGYHDLTARGVDLAPFLKRLADSIRIARRSTGASQSAAKASPFGTPSAVDAVDQQPVLVTHPAIHYAPEMQALRIGGTVIVEAMLDTTGHVVPTTLRITQSPNPVFDAESKRVVLAAVYRPARLHGRATRATIRQPITFVAY
jgi:TonB family protein